MVEAVARADQVAVVRKGMVTAADGSHTQLCVIDVWRLEGGLVSAGPTKNRDSKPLASQPGALEVLRLCMACPLGTLLRRRRPRTQAGPLRLPSRLLVPFMRSVTHCSLSTRPLPPWSLTNQLPPFDRLWRASSAGTGCQGPRRTTCRSQQRRAPTRSRCGWRWRACRQELAGPARRAAGACAEGSRAQQPASRLLTTAQRCRQAERLPPRCVQGSQRAQQAATRAGLPAGMSW